MSSTNNIDKYLAIGKGVLDVASKFVPEAAMGETVIELIQKIRQQTGMSTEELLNRAGATLDDNHKQLVVDLERLKGEG